MISKVIMTRLAQNQLSQYIGYIKRKFKNPQAAKAVAQDARETKALLLKAAETLKPCGDPDLRILGYRVILFRHHSPASGLHELHSHASRILHEKEPDIRHRALNRRDFHPH